jgi:hypothetical protein
VTSKEIEELKEEINQLKPILKKISTEDVVKSIRENRDSR